MNLKNVNHIDQFRRLKYPKNEMLIVGSGTMALFGLKFNNDIDIWTTENIIKKVSKDSNFISLTRENLAPLWPRLFTSRSKWKNM